MNANSKLFGLIQGLFIISFSMQSSASSEKISGRMGIVSNHLFRGESWSENQPALQGGLNYDYQENSHHLNLDLGTSLFNAPTLANKGVENSFFGKYSYRLTSDISLHAGGMSFRYPHQTSWDFGRYELGASWKHLTFQLERWNTKSMGYSLTWNQKKFRLFLTGEERFWGRDSSYLYSETSYGHELGFDWNVSLTLGYASFGDNQAAGYSNHYNHKLSLIHKRSRFTGILFLSDTNRVEPRTGKNIEDATLGVSLFQNF